MAESVNMKLFLSFAALAGRPRPRVCLFLLAGLLALAAAAPGTLAAALAEEHTVLYYLIEMQRRAKRTCNGASMPEAPSLMPSERLRAIARDNGAPGTARELESIPHMAATAHGATARQAFDDLVAGQCSALMGTEYRYIGASHANGRWTIILAASEPGPSDPEPASGPASDPASDPTSDPTSEMTPGVRPASGPNAVPDAGQNSGPGPAASAPAAGSAPSLSSGIPPAARGADRPIAAPGRSGPANVPPLPSDLDKPWPENRLSEAAPAKPIVVGEMDLDASGQPVGPMYHVTPQEGLPSGAEAYGEDVLPGPPTASDSAGPPPAAPGLAGPADVPPLPSDLDKPWPENRLSEAAPAKPIVVGEMEVDVAGRPLAPARNPGVSGNAATSSPGPSAPGASSAGAHAPRPEGASRAGVTPLEDTRSAVSPTPAMPAATSPARTAPVAVAPPAPKEEPRPSDMLALINAARARGRTCGTTAMPPAPALRSNTMLATEAGAHARDMAAGQYLSSTRGNGTTLGRRVADSGYVWGFVAENLSSGRDSADQVLRRWLDNEDQCHNLMAIDYEDIGIGFEPAGRYWSVIVAAPLAEGGPAR